MAKEGKADPKEAVEDLKAIEEEEAVRKELEIEIDPKDKELGLEQPEVPTVEPEVKPEVEALLLRNQSLS